MHMLDIVLPVLINVAFVTLFERKILGLSQFRRGPNKVQVLGLMQPIGDAVKLFVKEVPFLIIIDMVLFLAAPVLGLTVALWLWLEVPQSYTSGIPLRGLLLLTILSLGVYPVFLAG